MLVKESTETAFGTEVKGVTVQLTMEEAKGVATMLLAACLNPPKARDGMNTDWKAKELGGKLYDQIRAITRQ
jgi:hypothetical protein